MTKPTDKGNPANVIQLRKAPAVIEPADDWCANSKYGLLRSDKLESGKLVRLEDVAAWLGKTEPRDAVINAMFSKLILDEGLDGKHLFVLNSKGYAKPLISGDSPNPALSGWWQYFPEINSQSSAEDAVRDIADGWLRVWPGLSDPATDHQRRIESSIERNKERSAMAAASRDGKKYQGQYWPEDELLLGLLYAVAIPVAKSAELWGYGLTTQPKEQLPTSESNTPTTYAELVKARELNPGGLWTDAMVDLMAAEIDARSGQEGIRKGIGKQIFISAARVGQLLTRQTKRQPARAVIGAAQIMNFPAQGR